MGRQPIELHGVLLADALRKETLWRHVVAVPVFALSDHLAAQVAERSRWKSPSAALLLGHIGGRYCDLRRLEAVEHVLIEIVEREVKGQFVSGGAVCPFASFINALMFAVVLRAKLTAPWRLLERCRMLDVHEQVVRARVVLV